MPNIEANNPFLSYKLAIQFALGCKAAGRPVFKARGINTIVLSDEIQDYTFTFNDLNIRFMISSFSYYCTYLPSLLENEEILELFVYIKYVLDYANHRQFSEKYISKSVYEKHKRVLKEIQHIIDEQMDKTSLSTKDINKLKIKAKASIN